MPIEASLTTQDSPSLHDVLEKSYETIEKQQEVAPPPAAKDAPVEAPQPKIDATGRVHAQDGKFAPKEAAKDEVAPPPEEIKRPSSWKKDYWPHWDKLTKGEPMSREEAIALAKYQVEREGDFAKGVSTYKAEYDRVKPIVDALHPYQDMMREANMPPEKFLTALASTHQVLTKGSPDDKLRAFVKFATDYQIPLANLFEQREDGKVYFNQNYLQQQTTPQQGMSAADVEKVVAQRLAAVQLQSMVQQFVATKDKDGNPSYPHFDKVRMTMDGILRAGLAQDLPSAYQAALAMPQHSDLREAQQQQQRQAEQSEKQRQEQEAAQRARSKAVSPKTNVPTDLVTTTGNRKGLRAQLEENFDSAGSGRV